MYVSFFYITTLSRGLAYGHLTKKNINVGNLSVCGKVRGLNFSLNPKTFNYNLSVCV